MKLWQNLRSLFSLRKPTPPPAFEYAKPEHYTELHDLIDRLDWRRRIMGLCLMDLKKFRLLLKIQLDNSTKPQIIDIGLVKSVFRDRSPDSFRVEVEGAAFIAKHNLTVWSMILLDDRNVSGGGERKFPSGAQYMVKGDTLYTHYFLNGPDFS